LGSYIAVPLKPPSDEPTESVSTRLGKCSLNCAFTDGEKTAAVLERATSDDRSRPARARGSSSARGRPIASPVTIITFTRSRSMSSQIFAASKERSQNSTTLFPTKEPDIVAHCDAPCMRGAIARLVIGGFFVLALRSSGRSCGVAVTWSMPPPSVKITSCCRHTTPFGMPVVPPV
jgi:hypothetical protein